MELAGRLAVSEPQGSEHLGAMFFIVIVVTRSVTFPLPTVMEPKRVLTDAAQESSRVHTFHPSTPAELALQLQSVGRRVRKHVTEGYTTQRHTSAPPSPTRAMSAQSGIFTSANDILRDVLSSGPTQPQPPISPRKRQRQGDDEETSDSEDRKMAVDSFQQRVIKAKPRRLMQTQSLPSNLFGSQSIEEEDDWSVSMPSRLPPTHEDA